MSKLYREYDENGTLIYKECRGCNTVKPATDFYSKRGSHTSFDGLEHRCKICHKEKWRVQADDPKKRVKWLLERIRSKCKKLGLEFNLTEDDIDIPTLCPVLGRPLKFGVERSQSYERRGNAPPTDDSPSVDRIDPSKGYTKDNIVVVSWRANRIKGNATIEELRMIADFYAKYGQVNKRV